MSIKLSATEVHSYLVDTCKVRNETRNETCETERNEMKRNLPKRNETERNETKRNGTK